MEERSNKTIMCSVLFLDIVEYSKKSVSGQISLKDRFNSYLSEAIRDVPVTDRIILDTGDGAAINFLGDVEDALKAALSLRESLLNEDPDVDHPLLVRMGVNLGPVRLVRDINGRPNIVGDGINVAQRVMGFADVAQILVSRSYYDAVSRLSPQYAGMFHYQGSRTDKHVREHEVYAIGYPGDKTTLRSRIEPAVVTEKNENIIAGALERIYTAWGAASRLVQTWITDSIILYRGAQPKQRLMYVGAAAAFLLLLLALLVNWASTDDVPARPSVENGEPVAGTAEPVADAVKESIATPAPAVAVKVENSEKPQVALEDKPKVVSKPKPKATVVKPKPKVQQDVASKPASVTSEENTQPRIMINCTAGTEVFIDGVRKGSVGSSPLYITVSPGAHTVIVSHPSGVDSKEVTLRAGKTVEIRPNFCK